MAAFQQDENDSCACYFDATSLAPMPKDGDRKECFMGCMTQFLGSKLPGTDPNPEGAASMAMCEMLNGTATGEDGRFWPLYWCDVTYCGLGVDPVNRNTGQDPNVNKIINNCNGIGVSSVQDSGPPPQGFSCSSGKGEDSMCGRPVVKAGPSLVPGVPGSGPEPSTTTTTPTPTHATEAHPTASSKAATDTHGSSASAGPTTTTTSSSGLSHGAKIAVAVCSVLGLLILVGLIFVCLRRRKRRKTQFRSALLQSQFLGRSGGSRGGDGVFFPFSGRGGAGDGGYSPTPLIPSGGSAIGGSINSVADPPLTPPLRLRDRRLLLPSILMRPGTGRSSDVSPPLTPLTPAYSPNNNSGSGNGSGAGFFPPSPICAPTVNKLVPRHERTPTPQKIPIDSLPPLPPQIACAIPTSGTSGGGGGNASIVSRGSLNSSNTTASGTYCPSAVTVANSQTSLLRNEVTLSSMSSSASASTVMPLPTCSSPPGSPPRPPRPHDTPLEIPDLLSAAPSPSSMSPPPPTFRGFSPPPPGPLPSPPLPPLAVSVSVPVPVPVPMSSLSTAPTSPTTSTFKGFSGSYFLRPGQGSPRSFASPFGSGGAIQDIPRSVTDRKASSPTPVTAAGRTLELKFMDPPTTKTTNKTINETDEGASGNNVRGSWGSWDGSTTGAGNSNNNHDAKMDQSLRLSAGARGIIASVSTPPPIPTPVPVSPLSMSFSPSRSPFQSQSQTPMRQGQGQGHGGGIVGGTWTGTGTGTGAIIGGDAVSMLPFHNSEQPQPHGHGTRYDDDSSSGSEYDYRGYEYGFGSGSGSGGGSITYRPGDGEQVGHQTQAQGNAHDRSQGNDSRDFIGGAF